MPAKRYTYGIRIEGVGSDVTKTGGLVFAFGLPLSAAQLAASDYEWVGGAQSKKGLSKLPQASTSRTDMFTARLTASTQRFPVMIEDVAGVALMKRQLVPVGYIDEDVSNGESVITFSDDFDSSSFENTVVFMGDEAVRLDTQGTGPEFDVTRAMWGTRQHPLPRYTRVYTALPYRKARVVTVVRYDHADNSETTRWFGLLEDAPGTDNQHTNLINDVSGIVRFIREALVNKGAPDLGHPSTQSLGVHRVGTRVDGSASLPNVRVRSKAASGAHWGSFQIGTALVFARHQSGGNYTFQQASGGAEIAGTAALGSRFEDEPDLMVPAHELLSVVRAYDYENGVRLSAENMKSATSALTYPHHFLAIFLALALSGRGDNGTGYDILGPELGLDCDPEWFDLTDLEATIEATQEIEIDTLIIGWDGEPFSPWAFLEQECRARGMFPVERPTGKISVRIAREAGPAEVLGTAAPTVTALPDTLQWIPSEADGVDIISGRFGELPWRKGRPYSIEMLDWTDPENPVPQHSRRFGVLAERSVAELDMPTRQSIGLGGEALVGLAAARHIASPAIKIVVEDTGFGHGDFLRLGALDTRGNVLRDTNGETVAVDSSARWVGLCVGKRPFYENETAEIYLKLVNFYLNDFPRFRAPSAVVESVSGGTVITIDADQFTADDAAEFTTGDPVEVWTRNGQRRSGSAASKDVRTVTVSDTRELTIPSAFNTAPQAGDIIRLAHLSTASGFPETGNPNLFATEGLPYTYAADASGEIGPNDIEGHRYATGVSI